MTWSEFTDSPIWSDYHWNLLYAFSCQIWHIKIVLLFVAMSTDNIITLYGLGKDGVNLPYSYLCMLCIQWWRAEKETFTPPVELQMEAGARLTAHQHRGLLIVQQLIVLKYTAHPPSNTRHLPEHRFITAELLRNTRKRLEASLC